jgi:hypothetical protein
MMENGWVRKERRTETGISSERWGKRLEQKLVQIKSVIKYI